MSALLGLPTISNVLDYNKDAANYKDCDYWYNLGQHALSTHAWRESVEAFSNAIQLAATYHPLIHYECSDCYWVRARLAHVDRSFDPRADLDKAIFQDHRNIPALLMREWLSLEKGDIVAALRDRHTLEKLGVSTGWDGDLTHLPMYEDALTRFEEWAVAARLSGTHTPLRLDPLHRQFDRGPETEQEWLQLCRALAHPMPWRLLAKRHASNGNLPAAREMINHAIAALIPWHDRYHRSAAMHWIGRADAFAQLGETDLARNDLRRALDLDGASQIAKDRLAALA